MKVTRMKGKRTTVMITAYSCHHFLLERTTHSKSASFTEHSTRGNPKNDQSTDPNGREANRFRDQLLGLDVEEWWPL
jgi:hypothetical protein